MKNLEKLQLLIKGYKLLCNIIPIYIFDPWGLYFTPYKEVTITGSASTIESGV